MNLRMKILFIICAALFAQVCFAHINTTKISSSDFDKNIKILSITETQSDSIISGEVSGVLTLEHSPYIIQDTVIVPSGSTLTIEPGVTIKLQPHSYYQKGAKIIVFGSIRAIGTEEDSITITRSEENGYWGTILLRENSNNCRFEYCSISYGSGALVGSYSSDAAIYAYESAPTVKFCTFKKNIWGLCISGESGAIVSHCHFKYNRDIGIMSLSGEALLENILAHHNGTGVFFSGKNAVLKNSTIINNGTGVFFSGYRKAPAINCIIWNNSTNIFDRSTDLYGTAEISYSNIQGGWQGYGNIDMDPLFVGADSNDYHLQALSPCIDGGNPNSSYNLEPDYNGNIINMGAYGNTPEATISQVNSPEILITYPMLNFGLLSIHDEDSLIITIRNIGSAPLHIQSIERHDSIFNCNLPQSDIAPNGSLNIKVHITANTEGTFLDTLWIFNDDLSEEESFVLLKARVTSAIFGNISGVFQKTNSPYIIGADVTIPKNQTLTIEPGTRIEIMENASLLVYGTLYCNGTEEDTIVITTHVPGKYWGSLYFGQGSGNSEVSYSKIEYGECKNEYIDNFWGPNSYFIACYYSGPLFHHNIIKPVNGAGGLVVYFADTDITDNTVIGGYHASIRSCGTSSNIIRNTVRDNTCHGFSIDNGGTPHVENNLLINNYNGMYASDTEFDFVNNTIVGSSHAGMYLWNLGIMPNVKNNIIWDCTTSIMPYGLEDGNEPTVSYCNIQGGYEGQGNIDTIPYFVNAAAGNYRLADTSFCIDAGDPDERYKDPDNTRNDMGASGGRNGFYLSTPIVYTHIDDIIIPEDISLAYNYPNPFNPVTTIKFNVSGDICAPAVLRIHSSNGKLVKVLTTNINGSGDYTLTWDGTGIYGKSLASGVYVYTLTIQKSVRSGKMTLLK